MIVVCQIMLIFVALITLPLKKFDRDATTISYHTALETQVGE